MAPLWALLSLFTAAFVRAQQSDSREAADDEASVTISSIPSGPPPTGEPAPIAPSDPITPPTIPEISERSSDGDADALDPVLVTPGVTIGVSGGRVTTLQLNANKEIDTIELTGGLAHGNVTINPDNSIALVMSGSTYSGPLDVNVRVTYADGSTGTETISVNVAEPTHAQGWGMGEYYMMAEDANGDIIVETGDNHRKVYVSESDNALSRADIAALEGLNESDITMDWLRGHSEYGASEDMALKADLGMELWYDITGLGEDPGSHWLLFENGYEYNDIGRVVDRGAMGEDELHPLHITSWGDGPKAVLNTYLRFNQSESEFITFSDIAVTGGAGVFMADHVIFSDVDFTEQGLNIQNAEYVTLHDSAISYAAADTSLDWTDLPIAQGLFVYNTEHFLMDGNIIHHNAWEDGYNFDGTGEYMAPNKFSHNVYLQWNTWDVTVVNNIISQGGSYGAQIRGGGFVEDNIFVDNNAAVIMMGGNYKDFGFVGNFTLFADNLTTSAGYRTSIQDGATAWGMHNTALETVWLDNIVTHLRDPDNLEAEAYKLITQPATDQIYGGEVAYDDTIIFNWKGSDPARWGHTLAQDQNLEGVDLELAMQTTIQRFAAELLGRETATIDEMMDYLLALQDTEFDDAVTADDILAYFQAGFNMTHSTNGAATTHRFIPNDLGDGVRWDNRINWSNEELPDTGDNVDLGGNHVQYGGTVSIRTLQLGDSGELHVHSGKLTVTESLETDGASGLLTTDGAGQFWTNGYSDSEGLNIDLDGGRFANTGEVTGPVSMHVSDNAQAILATDGARMELGDGSGLQIDGSTAKVGFDGDDAAGVGVLQMAEGATLAMTADAEGIAGLGEFRSGAWDQDGPEVQSGVSMDGALKLDLTALAGTTGTYELIGVDALDGVFDNIHVYGLGNATDAEVIADYDTDTLSLKLTTGTGALSYSSVGAAGDGSDEAADLWAALTSGHGAYDEGAPELHDEAGEMEELALI